VNPVYAPVLVERLAEVAGFWEQVLGCLAFCD
jgi:hypothetical protein